jgi:hypothetical protein
MCDHERLGGGSARCSSRVFSVLKRSLAHHGQILNDGTLGCSMIAFSECDDDAKMVTYSSSLVSIFFILVSKVRDKALNFSLSGSTDKHPVSM